MIYGNEAEKNLKDLFSFYNILENLIWILKRKILIFFLYLISFIKLEKFSINTSKPRIIFPVSLQKPPKDKKSSFFILKGLLPDVAEKYTKIKMI